MEAPPFGFDPIQDLAFDDSFLTFDEFAQNVLADNSYFSYEPAPHMLDETPNLPAVTPIDSKFVRSPTSESYIVESSERHHPLETFACLG